MEIEVRCGFRVYKNWADKTFLIGHLYQKNKVKKAAFKVLIEFEEANYRMHKKVLR